MFGDTLLALNKGATVADLNTKMAEVVAAVRATAKAGAITVTLKVAPGQKGNAEMVFVEADIKVKLPVEKQGSTLFFTTEDNRLTRHDERQRDLDFSDEPAAVPVQVPAAAPAGPVKVIEIAPAKEAM
jgi:uncharacterized cupredoxin-like copper-binding protein